MYDLKSKYNVSDAVSYIYKLKLYFWIIYVLKRECSYAVNEPNTRLSEVTLHSSARVGMGWREAGGLLRLRFRESGDECLQGENHCDENILISKHIFYYFYENILIELRTRGNYEPRTRGLIDHVTAPSTVYKVFLFKIFNFIPRKSSLRWNSQTASSISPKSAGAEFRSRA